MMRSMYQCSLCAVQVGSLNEAENHNREKHPTEYIEAMNAMNIAPPSPKESLQDIFDILKKTPLDQLTNREQEIVMICQLHGVKV